MKYKISKKKVIEAICTEPLKAGDFFHGSTKKDNGKCSVCAVGAILRKTKQKTFSANDAVEATKDYFTEYELGDAYRSGNFLSILSCEFEWADNEIIFGKHGIDNADDFLRLHCLNIIEAFCPEVLEFET